MKFRFYYKVWYKGEMKYYKDIFADDYLTAKKEILNYIKNHYVKTSNFKIVGCEKIIGNNFYSIKER